MLSNAYFLAKFRFDTAENEPAKNLQKFCKMLQIILPILLNLTPKVHEDLKDGRRGAEDAGPRRSARLAGRGPAEPTKTADLRGLCRRKVMRS